MVAVPDSTTLLVYNMASVMDSKDADPHELAAIDSRERVEVE